jgi:hypothetical protein
MIAAKRSNRGGLAISALCHVGMLAVALLLARTVPQAQKAVPPDAMQVQIVMPKEMPRYSGTPSMLRISGTDQAAQSETSTAKSAQPVTPPPQPKDQHQTHHNAPAKPLEAQSTPTSEKAVPLPLADAAQMAMAQPAPEPSATSAEETPAAPKVAANAAYLALAGGRLGGGFAAPPINSPLVGYDFTVPFRELLSTCGALPPGVGPNEKISIVVRVFFNHDGTISAAPQLLEQNPSAEQQALMQSFTSGLRKCQPYTMLPPDRYEQWKTLDLVVHPRHLAQ